MTYYC